MAPAAQRFWLLAQRRVSGLTPDVSAALYRALRTIKESLSEDELTQLIASGAMEKIFSDVLSDAVMDRALLPMRTRLRQTTERGFKFATADLPKAGKIDGVLSVAFNHLSPDVVTAIRTLEAKVLTSLKDDIRDVVRAHIENGLRDGAAPRTVARGIRDVIGLGKSQLQEVANFRDALSGVEGRSVANYTLRNKAVDRLLSKGPLTPEQIDRYTEMYRAKRVAQNAETVTRSATFQSYKGGQDLAWRNAREAGVIPAGYEIVKTWVQIQRKTKREEHVPLNGETVPIDQPYSNGEQIPGENEYNCGCVSRMSVQRAA